MKITRLSDLAPLTTSMLVDADWCHALRNNGEPPCEEGLGRAEEALTASGGTMALLDLLDSVSGSDAEWAREACGIDGDGRGNGSGKRCGDGAGFSEGRGDSIGEGRGNGYGAGKGYNHGG